MCQDGNDDHFFHQFHQLQGHIEEGQLYLISKFFWLISVGLGEYYISFNFSYTENSQHFYNLSEEKLHPGKVQVP